MLVRRISPPNNRDSSRLIARPRPVPPYLRLVLPSACWNASKMICCLSGEMPMPVSDAEIATTAGARFRLSLPRLQPAPRRPQRQRHPAGARELEGVAQQVLDDLLQALGVGGQRLRQVRVHSD